ncbi:MAG TPA: hypothetical protein VHA52_08540 [Candidatus Babeliaceae bacterium]|nr:hypothetical protein [Candidatus Babeliaceae bacterium]
MVVLQRAVGVNAPIVPGAEGELQIPASHIRKLTVAMLKDQISRWQAARPVEVAAVLAKYPSYSTFKKSELVGVLGSILQELM